MRTREDYLRYEAAACTLAAAAETPEEREYFLGRATLHRARANELPSPTADGIDDSPEPTVITPQGPIPFSQIPEALHAMAIAWEEQFQEEPGDGTVKISGEDPQREYEDALAAHSYALAEMERTERLVDRARIAYERHLRKLHSDG